MNFSQQTIAYCLIFGQEINIGDIIFKDLINKLQNGKKNREINVCYTRYISLVLEQLLGENYNDESLTVLKPHHISAASFQTPSASEVSLTSHMLKVSKLSKEPDESLILPSEEVSAEATADKSQSETNMQPLSQPKDNQPKAVDTTEVPKKIVEKEEVVEEQIAQETLQSPYDTQLEIKVVKSFFTSHLSEVQDQTMNDYEESAATDSDDTYQNEVSHSVHTSQDDIASVERLISDEIKSSLPAMITNALQEQIPRILSATLKDCLPLIVKESLQTHNPAISEQFAETQAQLNKKMASKLKPFPTLDGPLSQEEFDKQIKELKRISDLKAEKEKSKQELRKLLNPATLKAQAHKWTKHKAKKAKMMEEYKHQISFRADTLPITKISYVVNSRKEATIKITRGDNPLNLIVHPNFRLKQLVFSEWLEVHAKMLGLPPPSELATFGLTIEERKRKRTEFIKEMFVTEDVRVDGMNRNLIPPPRVIPIKGLVIKEPESGIFYMNKNTDVAFQIESEFPLTPAIELIHIYSQIKVNSEIASEMYRSMNYVIEARDDCIEARKIVQENLDNLG
ncbi:hypothetical protein Tco_1120111 [Tanacetum coccineum]